VNAILNPSIIPSNGFVSVDNTCMNNSNIMPSAPNIFCPTAYSLNGFPHITVAAQNCNSLNISTECDKQLTKIIAITSLCTNVIFLSDIRMCGSAEQCKKIENMFLTNNNKQYRFHYNSTRNSRGVGILIDNSLNCTIDNIHKDHDENFLALTVTIDNLALNLVSVYGPNKDDITFYHHLSDFLSTRSGIPSIIGGDWNTTYSTDSSKNNIDIYNMSRPPSIIRSGWLSEVCASHGLIDPYRAVYPVTKDYTYTPHGTKKNRSRLDFFLISNDILNHVKKCSISDSPSIMLFDHKSISLDFTKDKVFSKLYINRTILSNPRTDDVVLAAFADTYTPFRTVQPLDSWSNTSMALIRYEYWTTKN
jgi:exonuclease III